jgi:Trm5-related predicted tRNA methylase
MSVTLPIVVGTLVRKLRGKMTQAELGAAAGIPQSIVSAIEVGNRKFDSDHLEKILRTTGTSDLAAIRLMNEIADGIARQEQVSKISPKAMAEDLKRLSGLEKKDASLQPTDKRARAKKKRS